MNTGKDDMREYCVNGQMSSSQNEEEEGPSTSTATGPSRTENVRRSLKDLKKDMGRNFDALVHRPRMERISESEGGIQDKTVLESISRFFAP
ncbi:unnamed protein product, partial [Mesorhabditis spiculigera]